MTTGLVQNRQCLNPACGKTLYVLAGNTRQSRLFCSRACRRRRHSQHARATRKPGR